MNTTIKFLENISDVSKDDLTNMLNSQHLYETKNVAEGNGIVNVRIYDIYSYVDSNGANGVYVDSPPEYDGEFEFLIKYTSVESDFAEGYNKESKIAYTWYELRIHQDVKNLVVNEPYHSKKPSRKIYVYYVRESDYSSIVRQVNKSASYIGIKKKYGSYISEYKYNGLIIKLKKSDDEQSGGTIEIVKDFPW